MKNLIIYSSPSGHIIEVITSRKMILGALSTMRDMGNAYKIFAENSEGKGPLWIILKRILGVYCVVEWTGLSFYRIRYSDGIF
jgi:hypothetical protein